MPSAPGARVRLRAALSRAARPAAVASLLWLLLLARALRDGWNDAVRLAVARHTAPVTPQGAPRVPTLNPREVSSRDAWGDALPLVDARVLGASGRRGRFAAMPLEHETGLDVAPGDTVHVAVYLATSATRPAPEVRRVAVGVSYAPPDDPSALELTALVVGEGVARVRSEPAWHGGHLPLRATVALRYVPGSTRLCRVPDPATTHDDPRDGCHPGLPDGTPLPDGVVDGAVDVGDLPPGFHGVVAFLLWAERVARE